MLNRKPPLVKQPGKAPSRKMAAVGITGAVATVLTVLLQEWIMMLGDLSPWLAFLKNPAIHPALPILAAWIAGYLFRDRGNPGA